MTGRRREGAGLWAGLLLTLVAACTTNTDQADRPTTTVREPAYAPSPTTTQGVTGNTPQWLGPVRPGTSLPTLSRHQARRWTDPRDTAFDGIDLRRVFGTGREYNGVAVIHGRNVPSFSAGGWHLGLVARPPRTDRIDPDEQVIEYGVVIDADGDRTADCHIGINNDARQRGRYPVYRVWVKNLRTGRTADQVGGPYGGLVEFGHPGDRGGGRTAGFEFLGDSMHPCSKVGPASRFFAYSSLTENGAVTAWDYAPDAAWLPMHCGRPCHEIGEQ